MIGIYDYSVELDDPRPMNHSNITSIFAYMIGREEIDIDDTFTIVLNDNGFLSCILKEYDSFKRISDAGLPQLEVDWGDYKAIFTACVDTDGLDVELYYKKNRVRPSRDKILTDELDMEHFEDDDDCGCGHKDFTGGHPHNPHLPHIEPHGCRPFQFPLYASPFETHYWYDYYTYRVSYKDNIKKTTSCDGHKQLFMIELDGFEDDEDMGNRLPSSTPMDLIWAEKLSHETLVSTIEIHQQ